MIKLDFDNLKIRTFGGKTGRFNYFLSVLIVLVGFYYLDTFYFSDRCLVCCPIMSFPWWDLLGWFVVISLMGALFLLLGFRVAFEFGISDSIIYYIILVLFFFNFSIRRCHDIGESGWRILIPIYSPLFLFFLPAELEVDQELDKPSILMTLWKSKWLMLILILMAAYIYRDNLGYIRMHNAL